MQWIRPPLPQKALRLETQPGPSLRPPSTSRSTLQSPIGPPMNLFPQGPLFSPERPFLSSTAALISNPSIPPSSSPPNMMNNNGLSHPFPASVEAIPSPLHSNRPPVTAGLPFSLSRPRSSSPLLPLLTPSGTTLTFEVLPPPPLTPWGGSSFLAALSAAVDHTTSPPPPHPPSHSTSVVMLAK